MTARYGICTVQALYDPEYQLRKTIKTNAEQSTQTYCSGWSKIKEKGDLMSPRT